MSITELPGGVFPASQSSMIIQLPEPYIEFWFHIIDYAQSATDYLDVQFSEDTGVTFHDGVGNYQSLMEQLAQPGFIQGPGDNQPLLHSQTSAGQNGIGPISFPGVKEGDKLITAANLTAAANMSAAFEATISDDDEIQQTSGVDLSGQQILFIVQAGRVNQINSQLNFFDTTGSFLFVRGGETISWNGKITPANKARIYGQGVTDYSTYLQNQISSVRYEGSSNRQNAMKLFPDQTDGAKTFAGGSYRLWGIS